MQFFLVDVSATVVFLVGYVTVLTLQRQRALLALAAGRPERSKEWPRLSAPR